MEYWRIYEKFAGDPALTDLTETQTITTGEQQNLILDEISALREEGLKAQGGFTIRDVVISEVKPVDGVPSATVEYCVDRRGVRLVSIATGKPVPFSGPETLSEAATFQQGSDGRWRVALLSNRAESC